MNGENNWENNHDNQEFINNQEATNNNSYGAIPKVKILPNNNNQENYKEGTSINNVYSNYGARPKVKTIIYNQEINQENNQEGNGTNNSINGANNKTRVNMEIHNESSSAKSGQQFKKQKVNTIDKYLENNANPATIQPKFKSNAIPTPTMGYNTVTQGPKMDNTDDGLHHPPQPPPITNPSVELKLNIKPIIPPTTTNVSLPKLVGPHPLPPMNPNQIPNLTTKPDNSDPPTQPPTTHHRTGINTLGRKRKLSSSALSKFEHLLGNNANNQNHPNKPPTVQPTRFSAKQTTHEDSLASTVLGITKPLPEIIPNQPAPPSTDYQTPKVSIPNTRKFKGKISSKMLEKFTSMLAVPTNPTTLQPKPNSPKPLKPPKSQNRTPKVTKVTKQQKLVEQERQKLGNRLIGWLKHECEGDEHEHELVGDDDHGPGRVNMPKGD